MKKALFMLLIAVTAMAWTSPTWAPGLNNTSDNYAASILNNGTVYGLTNNDLYRYTYTGSKTWNSGTKCTFPDTLRTITIDPAGGTAFVSESTAPYDVRSAYTSNGIDWALGSIDNRWNRNPHYPVRVTRAWRGTEKWTYVTYEDKIVWGAKDGNNPQQINLDPSGDGKVVQADVRFSGDKMVVSDDNGSQRDFYTLTSSDGLNWGNRTPVTPVNTSGDERAPVWGAIDGADILLGSSGHSGYGYDIWYSVGDSNSAINSSSLGRVKAMFR